MEKGKITNRQVKAEATRDKIYATAKKLFIENGIDNVSVDKIIETAGVSKGGFYVHFTSKDLLASLIINDYVEEVDLNYRQYLDSIKNSMSASELLILMVDKIASVLEDTLGQENMRILYKAHLSKTIDTASSISYSRGIYDVFNYIINKGIASGEFMISISPEELSNHFVLAMRGITFEWCLRYPDFDLKEKFNSHFNLLLKGIQK